MTEVIYILPLPMIDQPVVFTDEDQVHDYVDSLRGSAKSGVPMVYYEVMIESKLLLYEEDEE